MTRDASLDEFLGGDEAAEDDTEVAGAEDGDGNGDGDGSGDGDDAAAGADDAAGGDAPDDSGWLPPAAVESARSTYAWSPDGAPCAACDATVQRRWRDDSGLVCPDCKEW